MTTGLALAAVAVSAAATQFVAHRLGYHPQLGVPWFGHVYAPWSWASRMQAPWAANAQATFAYLTSGLMVTVAGGLLLGLATSNARRRKPRKHADVHGSARLMTEAAELRRTGLGAAGLLALFVAGAVAWTALGRRPEPVDHGGHGEYEGAPDGWSEPRSREVVMVDARSLLGADGDAKEVVRVGRSVRRKWESEDEPA